MEVTRLSSKGQIVIPRRIRENLKLEDGTPFMVMTQDGTICLRKIDMPKAKSWDEAVKPFREAAKKSGFSQDDLFRIIEETRLKKR